jgi:hypothetical protein
MAKEIYEILGRPVTKEQYEAAAKKMDAPQSEAMKKKWMMVCETCKRDEQPKESVNRQKTAMGKKKGWSFRVSKSEGGWSIQYSRKTPSKRF